MTKTFPRAAALAALIAAGAFVGPAQAGLPKLDIGGTIAGGSFSGVRLGPKETERAEPRSNDVVGESCIEILADKPAADGRKTELQRVRVCR